MKIVVAIISYTFRKNGILCFQRTVAADVADHYRTRRISFPLRTRSRLETHKRAVDVSRRLEAQWRELRGQHDHILERYLRTSSNREPHPALMPARGPEHIPPAHTSIVAVDLYIRLKGEGKPETFTRRHGGHRWAFETATDR